MTPNVPYEYTNRDLFEKSETYEYTELEGSAFLDAYLADRADAIEALDERLTGTEQRSMNGWEGLLGALSWADPDPVQDNLPVLADLPRLSDSDGIPNVDADRVATVPLLAGLLGVPNGVPPDGEVSAVWLNRLVERFEVHKRLYAAYGTEMRPVDDEPAARIAYPMLALAALVGHDRNGSLKLLNGALKICDALSSTDANAMDAGVAALSRIALDEERSAVRALAAEKEVPL